MRSCKTSNLCLKIMLVRKGAGESLVFFKFLNIASVFLISLLISFFTLFLFFSPQKDGEDGEFPDNSIFSLYSKEKCPVLRENVGGIDPRPPPLPILRFAYSVLAL